ncbi:glycosyltransferase family 2 protein [Sulfurimonas sp.]
MIKHKIYVVLPVYNEGKSIYNLLKKYDILFKKNDYENEIIVINDSSKDDSEQHINQAKKECSCNINYIKHDINMGLAGALKTGFLEIKSINDNDIVITMDGDDTHNPFLINSMINKIDEGADIVIASRYLEQSRIYGLSYFRIFLSHGARLLYKVIWRIKGIDDYTCNFRAYKGNVFNKTIQAYGEEFITEVGFTVTTEILKKFAKMSKIIVEVPMILIYSNKLNDTNMQIFSTIKKTLKLLWKM